MERCCDLGAISALVSENDLWKQRTLFDVFKIDFVTGSDKDQDGLLKLKLDIMKEWATLRKIEFQDEFRETMEKHWQRFWKEMMDTEFKTCEWIRIKDVHQRGLEKNGQRRNCM